MKHKTSFGFSELRSTGGRVLLDDDGLTAGAHVAMDLVADLDPKLSLILFSRGYGSRELADPILAWAG